MSNPKGPEGIFACIDVGEFLKNNLYTDVLTKPLKFEGITHKSNTLLLG